MAPKQVQYFVTKIGTREEGQDVIAHTKYSSENFTRTNSDILNSDDYFIAEERKERQMVIIDLEAAKKKSEAVSDKLNTKATRVIEELLSKGKIMMCTKREMPRTSIFQLQHSNFCATTSGRNKKISLQRKTKSLMFGCK